MREDLAQYLHESLGQHRTVREFNRRHGDADVFEVVLPNGAEYVAKQHARAIPWLRETRAYRRWAPALHDRAPRLHAADRTVRALVVSKVPGRPARHTPAVHRQAGELLRVLHSAAPERAYPDLVTETSERLDQLLQRADALLARPVLPGTRGGRLH